jgi:acetyl-CoA carboxylase biotin carboxyl carrier protein
MATARYHALLREGEAAAATPPKPGADPPPAPETGAGSGQSLLAPALGLFRSLIREGSGMVPDQEIGTLIVLDRIYPLLAPAGTKGRVTECFLEPGLHPVEYGQPLYRLEVRADDAPAKEGGAGDPARLSGRQFAVRSPTDGVFYRRPDPQSPPYVQAGEVVEPGHTLGLVEVMKCFNQVRFEGEGLPARARVVSIPIEDTAEIQYGQVLFVLEPAE